MAFVPLTNSEFNWSNIEPNGNVDSKSIQNQVDKYILDISYLSYVILSSSTSTAKLKLSIISILNMIVNGRSSRFES